MLVGLRQRISSEVMFRMRCRAPHVRSSENSAARLPWGDSKAVGLLSLLLASPSAKIASSKIEQSRMTRFCSEYGVKWTEHISVACIGGEVSAGSMPVFVSRSYPR